MLTRIKEWTARLEEMYDRLSRTYDVPVDTVDTAFENWYANGNDPEELQRFEEEFGVYEAEQQGW